MQGEKKAILRKLNLKFVSLTELAHTPTEIKCISSEIYEKFLMWFVA